VGPVEVSQYVVLALLAVFLGLSHAIAFLGGAVWALRKFEKIVDQVIEEAMKQ